MNKIESLRVKLQTQKKYQNLSLKQKFMLDLPIIEWKMGWYLTSIFMLQYYDGDGSNLNVDPKDLIVRLNKSTVFKNKYNNAINDISKGDIFNTDYIDDTVFDDLLINKCKSLSISETFNISLSDNFELGDFMNLFYVQDIDILDDFELDNLDDFAGSWGSVGIKFYFTGLLKRTDDYKAEIIINKMYFRLTDRFNFEGWQPLGNWSGSVFENNGKVTKPPLSSGYNLSNEDFRVLNISSGNIFPVGYRPVTKYYEINKLFSKIKISWEYWTSWDVE